MTTRNGPRTTPIPVRRLTEHLGYCPHSTPEDERAGLALQDMLGRLAVVFSDALAAFEATQDVRRQWFARWNEEIERG